MSKINITFPDGRVAEYEAGVSAMQVAESISKGLAKKTLAAKIDGEVVDAVRPIERDAQVELLTWDQEEGKAVFWHSSAHILAEAIESLYPGVKFGIGPPIQEGFYYDIDFKGFEVGPDEFEKIEKKFLELARSSETFERKEVSKAEALKYFERKGDEYKLELIHELQDGEITFYHSGNFIDLCKGPHLPHSKHIKAVKLLTTAGAYWRGDSDRKQLTRIYAVSFPTQKELDEHLHLLEEAKKRDHRKLGKELDMFSFQEEGPGFPFWHPNGMIVLNELQGYLRKRLISHYGYKEIKTPPILREELWQRSGHYGNYKENMYFVEIDESSYAVKPMNCPGSTLVYADAPRSYRDLPLRMFEFGNVHRHELSGVLMGLFRVRSFTQDDAHIFCTPDQAREEVSTCVKLIFETYNLFGFEDIQVFISTRPEDKYIGTLEVWDKAEQTLADALNDAGVPYTINDGDGAFYGPKIDFVVRDSLKREWQLGTVQLDFSMPQRFGLEYVGEDNESHEPVMIHRAVLGSFERFFGILLEHTAGNLPFWISPVQVMVLPISDKFNEYADTVLETLKTADIRAEIDVRSEKIGRKIRDAEVAKCPYMLVVGEKEARSNTVAIRRHGEGDLGALELNQLAEFMNNARIQSFNSHKPEPVTL